MLGLSKQACLGLIFCLGVVALGGCDQWDERQRRAEILAKTSAQQARALVSDEVLAANPAATPESRSVGRYSFVSGDGPFPNMKPGRWVAGQLVLTPRTAIGADAEARILAAINGLQAYDLTVSYQEKPSGVYLVSVGQDPVFEDASGDDEAAPHRGRVSVYDPRDWSCPQPDRVFSDETASLKSKSACAQIVLAQSNLFRSIDPNFLLEPSQVASGSDHSDVTLSIDLSKMDAARVGPLTLLDTGLSRAQLERSDTQLSQLILDVDLVSDPVASGDSDGFDDEALDHGDICDAGNVFDSVSWHGPSLASRAGLTQNPDAARLTGARIASGRIAGRCGATLADVIDGLAWASGQSVIDTGEAQLAIPEPSSVILLPFNAPGPCPLSLQSAINEANARGSLIVVSAGNQGRDIEGVFPGNCLNTVSVAAADPNGQLTRYSNFGTGVDFLAVGGDLSGDMPSTVRVERETANCTDPVTGTTLAKCGKAWVEGTSLAAFDVAAALYEIRVRSPELSLQEAIGLLSSYDTISPETCRGPCPDTPQGAPIDTMPGQCYRQCGRRFVRFPASKN